MKTVRRAPVLLAVMLGLVLSVVSGCQTWDPETGMTLPSPKYLRHPPQYIPPSPPFPLQNEVDNLEQAYIDANGGIFQP